jgi:hypothetical protein
MSSTPTAALPPELQRLSNDFEQSIARVRELLTGLSEERLRKRPADGRWSALECVAHLNLSNEAMLPGIREAVGSAPALPGGHESFRMDLAGRLLAWSLEPPARIKMKASTIATPVASEGPAELLEMFVRQHQELERLVEASAGRAITKARMKSPFANLRYNAYSALRIIAAHDRRHLWQARQALGH